MTTTLRLLFGLLFGSAVFLPLGTVHADDAEYRLREGDLLYVSIWKEETLQREVRVLPDGSITFPLAGRVPVSGSTVTEAGERIAGRLKKFLAEPVVTVTVSAIEGNRVFVLGKVKQPGPVVMNGPMTALQAISIAGGPTEFANGGDIKVLRHSPSGDKLLPVDYDDLLRGKSLQTDVQLNAGDTVLVP